MKTNKNEQRSPCITNNTLLQRTAQIGRLSREDHLQPRWKRVSPMHALWQSQNWQEEIVTLLTHSSCKVASTTCYCRGKAMPFLLGRGIASAFYNDKALFSQRREQNRKRREVGISLPGRWPRCERCTYSFKWVHCHPRFRYGPARYSICGALLISTTACRGVSASAVLRAFNIILCLMVLFLDKSISFLRMHALGLVRLYGMLAFLSLVLQVAATGILTSKGRMGSRPKM